MATAYVEIERRPDLEEVLDRHFPGCRIHDARTHYGESLSGAAIAVEFLRFAGAEVIFGIPGGASLPLNDALTQAHLDGAVRYVLTGHEQAAAFEAEGYAAASGRPGFCTATSGPGATNLVTGLADAYRDRRPVIALTGNTATTAEPEAFQAIDIVGITDGKATKASFRPERPEDVQDALVRAYHTAVTGRPGSVLLDLPKDVQIKRATLRPWEDLVARYDWSLPHGDDEALGEAARMLAAAERPVVYAGHGVVLSGAAEELRQLSRRFNIPVATTVHGLGCMPAGDPLNLGMLGMHGSMVANLAPYLSDVTLALGARFDDRVVGAQPDRFAPDARLIHVDVDRRQLNRVRTVDLAIHSDVKYALRRLLALLPDLPHAGRAPWFAQLDEIRRELPTPSYDDADGEALSHEFVYGKLAEALQESKNERRSTKEADSAFAARPSSFVCTVDGSAARDSAEVAERKPRDVIVTFDVGTHQMKGAQWFPVSNPRSFITSGGMGSMGCSLPMAVGAWFARPGATVVAAVGDGGFVMSSHELDTIGSYQLPVKVIVFDDSALGMVTNWHGLFFAGRWLTSDRRRGRATREPDVAALKETLQQRLDRAESADDLAAAVCEATAELAQGEWPLFASAAAAYGIPAERLHTKAQFRAAVRRALAAPGPYFLHVVLPRQNQVYPLMEPGTTPQDMVWRETGPGSGVRVYAREVFDYDARRLRRHTDGAAR